MSSSSLSDVDSVRGNNFNLIRLILASLVLFSHSFAIVDGGNAREPLWAAIHTLTLGEVAVDGFFLLSGFLIVGSYLRNPAWERFLWHRVLRIYPGFLVCSCLCALLLGPLDSGNGYFQHFGAAAFFGRLAVLEFHVEPVVFSSLPIHELDGSLWSLRPEFQCYLLALGGGVLGLFQRFRVLWLASWGVCVSACWAHGAGIPLSLPGSSIDLYRSLFRMAMFFVVGGAAQLYAARIRYTARGALLALGTLVPCLFVPWLAEPALALLGGYLLMLASGLNVAGLVRFQSLPDVSYGTYLYGWPIQQVLLFGFGAIHPLVLFACALPLSWAAGAASWHLVERPALALKNWDPRPRLRV